MAIGAFARNIKALRDREGLKQSELANAIGVRQATVSQWERGAVEWPRQREIISVICSKYDITEQDLFGFGDGLYAKLYGLKDIAAASPGSTFAPVIGNIAAGDPREACELGDEVHYVSPEIYEKYPDGFFLVVRGDSMDKVLPDGCYAYIAPAEQRPVKTGDIAAVKVNGDEATVKRVKLFDGIIVLEPESNNTEHKRRVIDESDPDAPYVRLLGPVVWYDYDLVRM